MAGCTLAIVSSGHHQMQSPLPTETLSRREDFSTPQRGYKTNRLEYHQASGHLKERGPGYYLILLRNELRHRSLRSKSFSSD